MPQVINTSYYYHITERVKTFVSQCVNDLWIEMGSWYNRDHLMLTELNTAYTVLFHNIF